MGGPCPNTWVILWPQLWNPTWPRKTKIIERDDELGINYVSTFVNTNEGILSMWKEHSFQLTVKKAAIRFPIEIFIGRNDSLNRDTKCIWWHITMRKRQAQIPRKDKFEAWDN